MRNKQQEEESERESVCVCESLENRNPTTVLLPQGANSHLVTSGVTIVVDTDLRKRGDGKGAN